MHDPCCDLTLRWERRASGSIAFILILPSLHRSNMHVDKFRGANRDPHTAHACYRNDIG